MRTISYQENIQLWKMTDIAKEAGYTKTSDAYWCQVFTNTETGHEFMLAREAETTNDPIFDLKEMLTTLDPNLSDERQENPLGRPVCINGVWRIEWTPARAGHAAITPYGWATREQAEKVIKYHTAETKKGCKQ